MYGINYQQSVYMLVTNRLRGRVVKGVGHIDHV